MSLKFDSETLTFSTGKTINVNLGIIGLSVTGEVHEGSDGPLFIPNGTWCALQRYYLTTEERMELGEYMFNRWYAFFNEAYHEMKGRR